MADENTIGLPNPCADTQIGSADASTGTTDTEDAPICWICLESTRPEGPLRRPCRCPRLCHATCIARWQLQSAGTRKETHCEFCEQALPDWKHVLTPCSGSKAPAVMNVNFDGRTYSFEVSSGPDGYHSFTAAIRKAFSLPDQSELNITFTCDEPSTGALLTLHGSGAYDAAVHCASVSAARRLTHPHSGSSHQLLPPVTWQHGEVQHPGGVVPARADGQASGPAAPLHGSPSGMAEPELASRDSVSGASCTGPSSKDRRLLGPGLGRRLRSAICDMLFRP